ncbi:MAG: hypothetical protein LBI62_08790 [Candidatus Accumulibacter sp.]|jgi:hypothetical protein|nr:hypothetical protein [Accumulibacter sp.]
MSKDSAKPPLSQQLTFFFPVEEVFQGQSIKNQNETASFRIRCQGSGIRYQGSGIRYQVSGIRYQVSGIRYQVSEIHGRFAPGRRQNHATPNILAAVACVGKTAGNFF